MAASPRCEGLSVVRDEDLTLEAGVQRIAVDSRIRRIAVPSKRIATHTCGHAATANICTKRSRQPWLTVARRPIGALVTLN